MHRTLATSAIFCCSLAGGPAAVAAASFSHVVIVVQENRTPDNLFGSNPKFEPGVDIATSGKASHDETIPLKPVQLASCYDLGHGHYDFMVEYNNGRMNGFDRNSVGFSGTCRTGPNPQYRYVANGAGEVQPYFDIAKQYGFANRMFQTNQGPSYPAHQIIFGGTSALTETSHLLASGNMLGNTGANCVAEPGQRVLVIDPGGNQSRFPPAYPCLDHPTMASLLDAAGLSWRYYTDYWTATSIWNAPAAVRSICQPQTRNGVVNCTGPDYVNNVNSNPGQVLTDISNCVLPKVSWVIPAGYDSDHAGGNRGTGPAWVASIVNAIGTQPTCPNSDNYWNDTAIIITWDDWGGWYDHVPPFHLGGWPTEHWGEGYTYGFRVPLMIVSAYTPAGYVDNGIHDFGSILQFTETNFGLGKIGPGYYADNWTTGLAAFFTLSTPRIFAPIAAKLNASYFLHRPPSATPQEED